MGHTVSKKELNRMLIYSIDSDNCIKFLPFVTFAWQLSVSKLFDNQVICLININCAQGSLAILFVLCIILCSSTMEWFCRQA